MKNPWTLRNLVSEARILSTMLAPRRDGEVMFTGESALVVLGLDAWWNNPDVTFRSKGKRRSPVNAPSISVGDTTVPAVRVVELRSSPPEFLTSRAYGVDIVEPHLVAADLARRGHPLQGFHNVSAPLRYLAQFNRFEPEISRQSESMWKNQMQIYLNGLASSKGVRQARAVIAFADAGLESPAESIVAWILNCILEDPSAFVTQHPVAIEGRDVYMDLAFPAFHVGIEVTGYGKFGDTESTARRVGAALVARQQALSETGWSIINVSYDQAKDVTQLASHLRKLLLRPGVPTHSPGGPLWAKPTTELFSSRRRF